jgi:CRP/FNR family cyclic AMP-dependent transcriptional regulator
MTADKARAIVLRRGWLSQTPKPFQRAILDRCTFREFVADASICMPGDPPGGMFGFVAGHLSVFTAPRVRVPYIVTPGTWFGAASAITGQPRRVGLRATRKTELLHLSLPAIHEIVSQDPTAWRLFGLVPLVHLDLAIGASDDLMIRDHVKRLIAVILRLGGCRLTTLDSEPIEVDVSQQDLAEMANVTRTTANRILRKLETSGHLDQSYRCIHILAPDALRAMLAE